MTLLNKVKPMEPSPNFNWHQLVFITPLIAVVILILKSVIRGVWILSKIREESSRAADASERTSNEVAELRVDLKVVEVKLDTTIMDVKNIKQRLPNSVSFHKITTKVVPPDEQI